MGIIQETTIGVIKGDTRTLDILSYGIGVQVWGLVMWRSKDLQHLAWEIKGRVCFLDIPCLKGHGDLVIRLKTPITHMVTPFICIINPFTKSP